MPVTVWSVNRFPPNLSQVNDSPLVLMTFLRFRHIYQQFICICLHSTYLTRSCPAFSLTLTTMAFVHSSLRWFETSTCMAVSRDLLSSSVQHSCILCGCRRIPAPSWRTIISISYHIGIALTVLSNALFKP